MYIRTRAPYVYNCHVYALSCMCARHWITLLLRFEGRFDITLACISCQACVSDNCLQQTTLTLSMRYPDFTSLLGTPWPGSRVNVLIIISGISECRFAHCAQCWNEQLPRAMSILQRLAKHQQKKSTIIAIVMITPSEPNKALVLFLYKHQSFGFSTMMLTVTPKEVVPSPQHFPQLFKIILQILGLGDHLRKSCLSCYKHRGIYRNLWASIEFDIFVLYSSSWLFWFFPLPCHASSSVVSISGGGYRSS